VQFAKHTCQACASREACTRSKAKGRTLKLRSREEHIARQTRAQEQTQSAFLERYNRRAGVEGTISQGVRACGLRQTRYIGLSRTHYGNVLAALGINIKRLDAWWHDKPRAKTRSSSFQKLELLPAQVAGSL
jgi:transposase